VWCLIARELLDWFWSYFVLDVLVCPSRLFYAIYKTASKCSFHELNIWNRAERTRQNCYTVRTFTGLFTVDFSLNSIMLFSCFYSSINFVASGKQSRLTQKWVLNVLNCSVIYGIQPLVSQHKSGIQTDVSVFSPVFWIMKIKTFFVYTSLWACGP
jgi:hypothetical protein